jgi:L-lactate dehydrogenase complex protein LldG
MATNSATTATFESSLDRLDVGWTRTTSRGLADALDGACEGPTVGTDLPFEGAELPAFVEREPSPSELEAARTGVTAATMGIADYGSVVIEGTPAGEEPVSLFTDRHVAVLRGSDVVPDMASAFRELGPRLREGASAVLATGPSATADMGELVLGAHGPESVHVVILDE